MTKWSHLRMRFPPFDAPSHIPQEMYETNIYWANKNAEKDLQLGSDDGWFIHRTISESPPESAGLVTEFGSDSATNFLLARRSGWALSPHPLHSIARKWIPFGVTILIFAIVLHVLEPVLLGWGLMSEEFAGSVNLGMLDYPILFVMAAPFVVIPIVMRMIANVADIRRQHRFRNNPPTALEIDVKKSKTDGPIKVIVNIPEAMQGRELRGHIRVGLLPPHRGAMMSALKGGDEEHPPVGFSTPVPGGWMSRADDGSGIGESTPMLVGRGHTSLFIEPMRVQENAASKLIESGKEVELETPAGPWPASEYGPFVNINWELVLMFNGVGNRPLYWIERLDVLSSDAEHSVPQLIAHTGRLEST